MMIIPNLFINYLSIETQIRKESEMMVKIEFVLMIHLHQNSLFFIIIIIITIIIIFVG